MNDFKKEGFELLWKYLTKQGLARSSGEIKTLLRKIHANAYSLSLWESLISKKDNNPALIYLGEIRSNAVQSIKLTLHGYRKATFGQLRGILESVLYYIYYYHHPVEFTILQNNPQEYRTIKELLRYLAEHPFIGNKIIKLGVNDRIRNIYFETSKFVHGTSPSHLEMAKSIDQIKFDMNDFRNYEKLLDQITMETNFVLGSFHLDYLNGWDREYQDAIFDTLTDKYKKVLWSK